MRSEINENGMHEKVEKKMKIRDESYDDSLEEREEGEWRIDERNV